MKASIRNTVEIVLDAQELIDVLRLRLDPEQRAKLPGPDEVEYGNLQLTHMDGKPYVFRWDERRKG